METELPSNDAAERAVGFINALTHTKGQWARKPFNLRPWQEAIVRRLFGTLRPDGFRQYRTAFIFLPRKQGKSELCAAFALYCLLAEDEPGGQILGAAADREQAGLIFQVAAGMVRNDPHLSQVCTITDSRKQIVYKPTQSTYRAIAADADHQHGFDASCVVYDELHAAPDANLWNVLRTSQGARRQPLMIGISTAGCEKHSVCYEVYRYACQVRDGIVDDPSFLPVIYEAPQDADWTDETVWHTANPALGDYRSLDEMRQMCREAQEIPAREVAFRQLYLNQWTETSSRWISLAKWDACAEPFDVADLEGLDCYAGLDLAYRTDVAALVLVFRKAGLYYLLPGFWLPSDGCRQLDRPPFSNWVRDGLIDLTPGASTDFAAIRKTFDELASRFNIRRIAVDPWNARQLSSELIDDGFEVQEFRQSMANFNEPCKSFEALVNDGKIRHNGDPVLRWMISNVCVETDASGNYRPSKKKSSEKIDGVTAALMGFALATAEPEDDGDPLPPMIWVDL